MIMSKISPPHLYSTWVLMLMFVLATCDIEQDKKKCENTLLGMATCLPFVSGQANVPSIDCCTSFNQVIDKSAECICLLIKDRNDPSLGLQINATRALSLPTRCKSHSNQTIGDCPAILHLPPNSPDAKVFEDFANTGGKSNATGTPSVKGNSSNASIGTKTSADHSSNGGRRRQTTWFGNEMPSIVLLPMAALVFSYPLNFHLI